MSKILSENYEEVTVEKKKRLLGIKCDCCERTIQPVRGWENDESKYFRVTTGHNDWGYESVESIEHYDICPECIGKFVSDYCGKADGTEYINIETEYVVEELVSLGRYDW